MSGLIEFLLVFLMFYLPLVTVGFVINKKL